MIYASLIMAYCLIEHQNIRPKYRWLPLGLFLHSLVTTALVASPALAPNYASPLLQFVCFHVSFAASEVFTIIRTIRMYQEEKTPRLKQIYMTGLMLWLGGILCWVLDYVGCEAIWEGDDGFRRRYLVWTVYSPDWVHRWTGYNTLDIGVPNPQFHAWWHVFAVSWLLWIYEIDTNNSNHLLFG